MKAEAAVRDCPKYGEANISSVASNDQEKICQVGAMQDPLISNQVAYILIAIFQVALTGFLAVCGMATNTINIVVFIKMGLNDSVNISLFGLAIGDLLSLVFSFWESICFNPLFQNGEVSIVFTEIEYITGCWPHVCFVRVASYITAFVTFERCLCIMLPLKVRTIITTARAKVVIVAIFFLVTVTSIPEYYVTQLDWKFYPDKNRTMLGVRFIEDRERFEHVTLVFNNVAMQCLAFLTVVVCTAVLIIQLNRKSKWRNQTSTSANKVATPGKDTKVIKMISSIAIIFIICNLPSCVVFLAMACTSDLHPSGVNYNMFYVAWAVVYVVEGIHSSISLLVYLNMSSKFKNIFYKTFLGQDINFATEELH